MKMTLAEFILRLRAGAAKQLLRIEAAAIPQMSDNTLRTNRLADLENMSRGR